jgi:hypothetical protein
MPMREKHRCVAIQTRVVQGKCGAGARLEHCLTASLLRRNCAQSNSDAHNAMTVASKLRSLFLERNLAGLTANTCYLAVGL